MAVASANASAFASAVSASPADLLESVEREFASLRSASQRGLSEMFDSSAGAASVLFPWGGSTQGTPECAMAALLPALDKQSLTASIMSFGYDPYVMEASPYLGAKAGIREALAKYACLGGDPWKARLSLQEYFASLETPELWGKPAQALLGAIEAQLALGVPAIGGKDSMSGNYRDPANNIDIAVPPTVTAFAAGIADAASIRGGALSGAAGNVIVLFAQKSESGGGGEWDVFKNNMNALAALSAQGAVRAAYPYASGGLGVTLSLMAFGNNCGVEVRGDAFSIVPPAGYQGSILAEIDGTAYKSPAVSQIMSGNANMKAVAVAITLGESVFRITGKDGAGVETQAEKPLADLRRVYESPLLKVYPQTSAGKTACEGGGGQSLPAFVKPFEGKIARQSGEKHTAKPLVLVPVFPGANSDWDVARAFTEAGARVKQLVFKNRTQAETEASLAELAREMGGAQILALAGAYSCADDAFGSGRFMAAVLGRPAVRDALNDLVQRGLVLGINNGFAALLKLGLLPYGDFRAQSDMPHLAVNKIGRHVSRMARTKVMSLMSPWLSLEEVGGIHITPASHLEGRLVMRHEKAEELFANGQVAFCYADAAGQVASSEPDNPGGCDFAIEGLTSPDGRVLGKLCHSERRGQFVHVNIPGNKTQNIFAAGVRFFA